MEGGSPVTLEQWIIWSAKYDSMEGGYS